MKVKKSLLFVSIAVISIAILLIGLYLLKTDPIKKQIIKVKTNPPKIPEVKEDVLKDLIKEINPEGTDRINTENLTFEQMVALYRKNFGKNIQNQWVQIKFIEDLIRHLKAKYPDTWITELYVMIHATFPNLANEIFAKFEKLQEYNQWLEKKSEELSKLSPEERSTVLWNKRYEVFGEDSAKEIWASEWKALQVKETLHQIDQSSSKDIDQKIQEYRFSLQKIYGDQYPDLLTRKSLDLTELFLQLPSIQKELKNMDSEARYKTLKQIRLSLGMDSNAVQRLENLDKERDIRWELGNQYMMERESLIKSGAGEEEIHNLRLKFFNPEMAEILKQEEESGFFRFKEPRNYGLN